MAKQTVKVYSTSWCGFCKQAKSYFDSIGVNYSDVDVELEPKEAEEMVNKSQQMGVPVIEIGEAVIVGYDRPKIDAALKTAGLLA
jgi:glutaredoxin-like YruB-family protein